jgi:uncharacterized membrane protein YdbT with pleckstrin-like domain
MKALQGLFGLLYGAGFIGNGLLFLYVEWSYLRQSFLQVFNPVLHLQVVLAMLTMPLFWILTVVTVLGYFAMASVQKHIDEAAR